MSTDNAASSITKGLFERQKAIHSIKGDENQGIV